MTPIPVPHKSVMMIDIETLALATDAYVTQVGLCVSDRKTGETLVPPTNYWTTPDQPGKIDFNTVRWWVNQDPKVAANVFNGETRTHRDQLFRVIERYVELYDCEVWASPAMFDLPILTTYFGNRKPWKYNVERCMMTLYKLVDPEGKLRPADNAMGHDAAADAAWQMQYLFKLLATLPR